MLILTCEYVTVPFIQEVSGVCTSLFLDTDELKMALRARKVSVAFEKRAPGPLERCLCFAAPFRSVGRNLELAKMLLFPVLIVHPNDGYKMADEVYFE